MKTILAFIRRYSLVFSFILAFVISWAFWLPAVVLNISIRTPAGRLLETAGNFGPFWAALVVIYATRGLPGLRSLGKRLVDWRLPAGIYLVALLDKASSPRARRGAKEDPVKGIVFWK